MNIEEGILTWSWSYEPMNLFWIQPTRTSIFIPGARLVTYKILDHYHLKHTFLNNTETLLFPCHAINIANFWRNNAVHAVDLDAKIPRSGGTSFLTNKGLYIISFFNNIRNKPQPHIIWLLLLIFLCLQAHSLSFSTNKLLISRSKWTLIFSRNEFYSTGRLNGIK